MVDSLLAVVHPHAMTLFGNMIQHQGNALWLDAVCPSEKPATYESGSLSQSQRGTKTQR